MSACVAINELLKREDPRISYRTGEHNRFDGTPLDGGRWDGQSGWYLGDRRAIIGARDDQIALVAYFIGDRIVDVRKFGPPRRFPICDTAGYSILSFLQVSTLMDARWLS